MKDIPSLTVFTPTYNRAHTLGRTYQSLCKQTCTDFEWLIIDDGSTDGTEQLVFSWLAKKNDFRIRYIKKRNGGLHTGYTAAISNIRSELNICIDSDDYMPTDAIERIIKIWQKVRHKDLAGLVGLDFLPEGQPIGGYFSELGTKHFYEIGKFHKGDSKIVCRTDVLHNLPQMKSFGKEKNFNPIYYYMQIDCNYKFFLVNENLCIVDYQPQGMSAGIFKQYRNSPRSFAELRRLAMRMPYYSLKRQFINAAHYVSSSIFAGDWRFLFTSPRPVLTIFASPFGIALNFYIRYKTHKLNK